MITDEAKVEQQESPPLDVVRARKLMDYIDAYDAAIEAGDEWAATDAAVDAYRLARDGSQDLRTAVQRLEEELGEEEDGFCDRCGRECAHCGSTVRDVDFARKHARTLALAELGRAERALYRPLREVPA